MDLTNEFTVRMPVDDTWALLTDLERIAPCMPGAQLQEVEGDEYRGVVKVKVGPITAQYKGTATFVSRDDDAHVAVLRAEGRDTRGQGNAAATITATVTPVGDDSHVSVVTDLTVTGKVAQFGRNVLADVSAKLLTQFVQRLEADLVPGAAPDATAGSSSPDAAASEPAEASGSSAAAAPGAEPQPLRRIDSPPAEPIDLLGTAGPAFVKPLAGLAAVAFVLWVILRRRSR